MGGGEFRTESGGSEMNLKPEELVEVLLYCGNGGDCDACCHPCHGEHGEFEWRCLGPLLLRAATQIERDQKVIAELREENERLTRRLFEPRPVPTTSTL